MFLKKYKPSNTKLTAKLWNDTEKAIAVSANAKGSSGINFNCGTGNSVLTISGSINNDYPVIQVKVKNTTTSLIKKFTPVTVSGALKQNPKKPPILTITDTITSGEELFCILSQNAAPNAVVTAVVYGVFMCYVHNEGTNADFTIAGIPDSGSLTNGLILGREGVNIIWRDTNEIPANKHLALCTIDICGLGGGGFSIQEYDKFPAIPDVPTIIYCHDNFWCANDGWEVWLPFGGFSIYKGVVGT